MRDNNKIVLLGVMVLLGVTVHQTSRGGQQPHSWPQVCPAAESPKDIWWAVSHKNTVWFLSRDVKNTKFNQYSPVVGRRLTCPSQDFGSSWCFICDIIMVIVLWPHVGGAWHVIVFTSTAIIVNSRADVALGFIQSRLDCGKSVIRKIISPAGYGP